MAKPPYCAVHFEGLNELLYVMMLLPEVILGMSQTYNLANIGVHHTPKTTAYNQTFAKSRSIECSSKAVGLHLPTESWERPNEATNVRLS